MRHGVLSYLMVVDMFFFTTSNRAHELKRKRVCRGLGLLVVAGYVKGAGDNLGYRASSLRS